MIFSETHHQELRPQRGKAAVLKLIQALVKADQSRLSEGVALALDKPMARLRRVVRPGSLVIIISDFRGWNERAESHLLQIVRHNSIWLLFIADPVEVDLPSNGIYRVTDGQQQTIFDGGSQTARANYATRFRHRRDHFETLCRSHGMSLIPLSTQSSLQDVLRNELITRAAA